MSFYSFIQPQFDFLLTEANYQMQRDFYEWPHRRQDIRLVPVVCILDSFEHMHTTGIYLSTLFSSDLNYFFQVFIRNSLKYTIILTTSMVICVNILHERLKVNTQKEKTNDNMEWRFLSSTALRVILKRWCATSNELAQQNYHNFRFFHV